MPKYILTHNRASVEVSSVQQIADGALVRMGFTSDEEGLDAYAYQDGMIFTGLFRPNPHGTLEESTRGFWRFMARPQDIQAGELLTSCQGKVGVLSMHQGNLCFGTGNSESLNQQVPNELALGLRRQIEEILSGVSPKLQERLSQFENGRPGQESIREPVMAEVVNFIARLSLKSDAVSATMASDGTLSVAADFPGEVRLYAEIERDGGAEAAVIKERLDVAEIPEDTVATLTSEVVLAAVQSI